MNVINREYVKDLCGDFYNGKAIVLFGARQCGKTTMMKQIIRDQKIDAVMLNGDDDDDAALFNAVTMARWQQILRGKKFIFIDECQRIPNIGRAVKLLIDNNPNIQVILTGSSSFDIANKTEESLTGRKFVYNLFPLTFKELTDHFGFWEERKKLELRLVYGSYPEVVCHEERMKEILKLIAESYMYRDLFQYEGIRKSHFLTKLLKALAYQCGSEVSENELAGLLGVSRTLIDSYIKLLADAFIIFPLTSYSTNQRNELKKSFKCYFWDNGIRNAVIGDFKPLPLRNDIGILWENYIISERMKMRITHNCDGFSHFWRTTDQMEVDYLEVCGDDVSAYEIKWNTHKKARVTKAFTNRYPNAKVSIITPDNYDSFILPQTEGDIL
ncbi:MAG: ATP-binding protein [Spirochaetales bacterium]|nr:ATP-binding protein [Spirochaetales bacterium]